MAKKIYVGNLPPTTTADSLKKLFGRYGKVGSVRLESGRRNTLSAYVEMSDGAEKAVRSLDRRVVEGHTLNVNEA